MSDDGSDPSVNDTAAPMALTVPPSGPVKAHAFRLRPGNALMQSLRDCADVVLARRPPERCSSAFILTAVGSLRDVTLRLANASRADQNLGSAGNGNEIKRWSDRRFEIVSLVGTFSRDGGCHLHVSLADAEGVVVGGHLMDGVVFTTCEVVLGTADGIEFSRVHDEETGYRELEPRQLLLPENEGGTWWKGVIPVALGLIVGVAIGMTSQRRR